MTWLGPSLFFSTTPAVFGYGLHGVLRASDRVWTWVALGVAGVELILWCLALCSHPVLLLTVGLAAGITFALKYIADHC